MGCHRCAIHVLGNDSLAACHPHNTSRPREASGEYSGASSFAWPWDPPDAAMVGLTLLALPREVRCELAERFCVACDWTKAGRPNEVALRRCIVCRRRLIPLRGSRLVVPPRSRLLPSSARGKCVRLWQEMHLCTGTFAWREASLLLLESFFVPTNGKNCVALLSFSRNVLH